MNTKLLAAAGFALVLAVSACGDDNDNDNPTVPTGVVEPGTPDTVMTDSTMMTETTIAG